MISQRPFSWFRVPGRAWTLGLLLVTPDFLPGCFSIVSSLPFQDLNLLPQASFLKGSSESRRNPEKENDYHPGGESSQNGVNERCPKIPDNKLQIDGWRRRILNGKYKLFQQGPRKQAQKRTACRPPFITTESVKLAQNNRPCEIPTETFQERLMINHGSWRPCAIRTRRRQLKDPNTSAVCNNRKASPRTSG